MQVHEPGAKLMKSFCDAIQECQNDPNYNGLIDWREVSEKLRIENEHLVPGACLELWNFIAFGKEVRNNISDQDLGEMGDIETHGYIHPLSALKRTTPREATSSSTFSHVLSAAPVAPPARVETIQPIQTMEKVPCLRAPVLCDPIGRIIARNKFRPSTCASSSSSSAGGKKSKDSVRPSSYLAPAHGILSSSAILQHARVNPLLPSLKREPLPVQPPARAPFGVMDAVRASVIRVPSSYPEPLSALAATSYKQNIGVSGTSDALASSRSSSDGPTAKKPKHTDSASAPSQSMISAAGTTSMTNTIPDSHRKIPTYSVIPIAPAIDPKTNDTTTTGSVSSSSRPNSQIPTLQKTEVKSLTKKSD